MVPPRSRRKTSLPIQHRAGAYTDPTVAPAAATATGTRSPSIRDLQRGERMVATCSNLWMDAGFDDPIKRPFKQNSVAYRMALRAYAAYRRDVYGEPASMAFDNADTAVRSHLARRREERKLYGWQGAISW